MPHNFALAEMETGQRSSFDNHARHKSPRVNRVTIACVFTLVVWASVYSAVKFGLRGFDAWQLAFLRLAFASTALGLFAAFTKARLPARGHWPGLCLVGFVGFAAYLVLLNSGQRTVDAGTASFIISATPALSVLFAVLFLKESLRPIGFLGVAISFCGVTMIVASGGDGLSIELSWGALILVLAAVAHAMHFILQKALLKDVSPFQVTIMSIWAGTAFLLPFAPDTVQALAQAPMSSIIAAAYLGIVPSAIAYVTWAFVMSHMPATQATSLLALGPPMAVVIGAITLQELPSLLAFLGGAATMAGVAIVQKKGRAEVGEKIRAL